MSCLSSLRTILVSKLCGRLRCYQSFSFFSRSKCKGRLRPILCQLNWYTICIGFLCGLFENRRASLFWKSTWCLSCLNFTVLKSVLDYFLLLFNFFSPQFLKFGVRMYDRFGKNFSFIFEGFLSLLILNLNFVISRFQILNVCKEFVIKISKVLFCWFFFK